MPQKQTIRNVFAASHYMFNFVWREHIGKIFIALKLVFSIIDALIPFIYIFIPGLILDELLGEQRLERLALYIGISLLTGIIRHAILEGVLGYYLHKVNNKLNIIIDTLWYNHITRMDYENFEKPSIQIMTERAGSTLRGGCTDIITRISDFIAAIMSLIAVILVISQLNPLIIAFITLISLATHIFNRWVNKRRFAEGQEWDIAMRLLNVFEGVIQDKIHAKQLRIFDLKQFIIKKIIDSRVKGTDKLSLRNRKRRTFEGFFFAFASIIQNIVFYIYLIYKVIAHELTIGAMTIYMTALNRFASSFNNVIQAYAGLSERSLYILELKAFFEIPLSDHSTGNETPIFDSQSQIEFCGVSYKYPGSDVYALKNVTLKLHGCEKLCIVGENGSGKSTFIKLLTRLYTPCEGEIFLNGKNIKEYNYTEYQKIFAPVFQDFVHYHALSLSENIVLQNKKDEQHLNQVGYKSGLNPLIKKLSKGYDTSVYKWIDPEGFEPSGGESQRIAIARAIYNNAEILLLDEPTAALDPIAEHQIYSQFNAMVSNKTAVIITHRLSAVQLADKIAVFNNGAVVEYGTHSQLYTQNGLYKNMFDKQSKFYIQGLA